MIDLIYQILPKNFGLALMLSLIYLMMWCTFDLLQDRLLWSLKCKRGDEYFKRNWRNIWKYFYPSMTLFITGLLITQSVPLAFKFFLYSMGWQIIGMEDALYFWLQGKRMPEKLDWLPPWINTRKQILINILGFLLFALTFIEWFVL